MLVMLVWVWIQQLTGITQFFGDSIVYSLYIMGVIIVISATRNSEDVSLVLRYLAWGILIVSICSVYIAAVQSTCIDANLEYIVPVNSWRRPGANLAQPNNLGTLLNWGILSAVYLYLRRKIQPLTTILAIGLLLIGLSITESRSALVGILLISGWLSATKLVEHKWKKYTLSIVLSLSALVLFFVWPKLITIIQEGAWNSQTSNGASLNTQTGARLVVWQQLVESIMMQPGMGWGVGGVSAALSAVLIEVDISLPFSYSHNVLLDVAIWFGLPFALVFIIAFFIWFIGRCRVAPNPGTWYATALLIPFLTHSLFEFPFTYSYFLFPACIAIASLDLGSERFLQFSLPRNIVITFGVVWGVLGVAVIRDYLAAEEDFRVARMEALRIGKTPLGYESPSLFLLNQLETMNIATRAVPRPNMNKEEIELLRMAALRYPWPAIQNRYALALALNGSFVQARLQLNIMRAMHGERVYRALIDMWRMWAEEKYPQLKILD